MAVVGSAVLLAGLGGCTGDAYPADAGTDLRDGFQVLDGSRLLGPVFIRLDDHPEDMPITWSAVLEVTGDPVTVWRRYLDAADPDLNPDLPDDETYGCYPETDQPQRSTCFAVLAGRSDADGSPISVTLELSTSSSDITGHYLLQVGVSPGAPPIDDPPRAPGRLSFDLPPDRDPPAAGEPLTSYGLRDVKPGSRLVAAYTGYTLPGFIFAVEPGSDVVNLMNAYAAVYVDGSVQNWQYERAGVVYRTLDVEVGGDGGSMRIHAVDQAGDDDDFLYVHPYPD